MKVKSLHKAAAFCQVEETIVEDVRVISSEVWQLSNEKALDNLLDRVTSKPLVAPGR
jgi:hypothetical protein